MSVGYRKIMRENLQNRKVAGLYYPLPKALRIALGSGVSVKIEDFGVFRFTVVSDGQANEEDCAAKCVKRVKITFGASGVAKSTQSARGATGLKFYNVDAKDKVEETVDLGNTGDGGGGNAGDDGGIDPDT